ncbi:MAG: DUF4342 domain-containing protein [Chloroflexi bacterium]|nr:DUF4342 domain-containing protein [Chloroflexota bacterium]
MVKTEKFRMPVKDVMEKVRRLVHEGNIRRVCLIHQGKAIVDISLASATQASTTAGVFLPLTEAVATFATLVSECTIEVERVGEEAGPEAE